MPVPLAIALGIGGSIAAGYAMDYVFGDRNYTKQELATDIVLGALGVSAAKAVARGGGGVYAGIRARRAAKAGDITDAGAYARSSNYLLKSSAVDTAAVIAVDEAISAVMASSPGVASPTVTVGGSAAVTTPVAIGTEPGLARRQLRNAKKGVVPTKNRCTRKYRGRQCVRTWPHPGKHMYV